MKQNIFLLSRYWLFLLVAFTACARLPRQYPSQEVLSQAKGIVRQQQPRTSSVIDINTASAAELETLPGIGPGLAQRIVTFRQEHGLFRRPEHLMMVRGISERKFREIRQMLTAD
jgi:competence ComEA-like helix-hairpin-helix protein